MTKDQTFPSLRGNHGPDMHVLYRTELGRMLCGDVKSWTGKLANAGFGKKVDLIFTSPPFPLVREKEYGNRHGEEFSLWLVDVFANLVPLLSPTGSLVVEMGNAWVRGRPAMSLVPLKTLIQIAESTGLDVCQQFIAHNPSRLPSPTEWVNRKRVRVKDSYTHIWWFANADNAKANNRNVLRPYSAAMRNLLRRQTFNAGKRPSSWSLSESGFLKDNGGSIPSSVITAPHTLNNDDYIAFCKKSNLKIHPARIQREIPEFFIQFCTDPKDIVLDPFAGSNIVGEVAEKAGRRWLAIEIDPEYAIGSLGRFPRAKMEKR